MRLKARGATQQTELFYVASQATGLGVPNLTFASFTVFYYRRGDTQATAISLSPGTLGSWVAAGQVVAVDNTNAPGAYYLSHPDAFWAAGDPTLFVAPPTGSFVAPISYKLTGPDFSAAPGATNALPAYGTGSGQFTTSGGSVSVASVANLLGISLSSGTVQASPGPTTTTFSATGSLNLTAGLYTNAAMRIHWQAGSVNAGANYTIIGDTVSGSVKAFTVNPAMSNAPTSGDSFVIF